MEKKLLLQIIKFDQSVTLFRLTTRKGSQMYNVEYSDEEFPEDDVRLNFDEFTAALAEYRLIKRNYNLA